MYRKVKVDANNLTRPFNVIYGLAVKTMARMRECNDKNNNKERSKQVNDIIEARGLLKDIMGSQCCFSKVLLYITRK